MPQVTLPGSDLPQRTTGQCSEVRAHQKILPQTGAGRAQGVDSVHPGWGWGRVDLLHVISKLKERGDLPRWLPSCHQVQTRDTEDRKNQPTDIQIEGDASHCTSVTIDRQSGWLPGGGEPTHQNRKGTLLMVILKFRRSATPSSGLTRRLFPK